MWRNYLTVGIRALLKNKTYAFINIFGLGIGLAACLLLLIYVRYETSYDEWLPNAENVYQFQDTYTPEGSGAPIRMQMSPYVSGQALKKDFPQVEQVVFLTSSSPTMIRDGEALVTEDLFYTDGPLLDVLQLPLVRGDRRQVLANVRSLILSESESRRLFGSEDPIGQTLTLTINGEPVDHNVTGVFRDLPRNSHLKMSIIARFDPTSFYAEAPGTLTQWGWTTGYVYARLRPGTYAEAINGALAEWERRNIPDQPSGDRTYNHGDEHDWRLVNIRDVHLGEAQMGAIQPGNDRATIVTFAIIAMLILAMACVNFTNLATARASQRAREVALRKALGARRGQLVTQFLGESVLIAVLAMVLALAFVELALPAFNAFLDADMAFTYFGSEGLLLPIASLILIVGAAGGIYPALFLSRFQPAEVLKANKSSSESGGTGRLRNALVVAQFAVSIGLIICTVVVYAQTLFARNSDPGFQREGLLQVSRFGGRQAQSVGDTLVREIGRIDGVRSVTRTMIGVATGNTNTSSVHLIDGRDPVDLQFFQIDPAFFDTMGIRVVAGRNFSESQALDDATTPTPEDPAAEQALLRRGVNVIVNETAAARLGFTPQQAIGKQVRAGYANVEGALTPATIVGVVSDARFRSIRIPRQPIIYHYARTGHGWLMVRFEGNPATIREQVEQVWRRLVPDGAFEAEFADDLARELYDADEARGQLFAAFSVLAVTIACLGLFGLAAFTAERRTKEIGIRKVLGARTRDIVQLLAWQFSKPIIVANLIAWPIAWWLMRDWLNTFDTRIDLGPMPFVAAAVIALVIAIGTIAGHAIRVARANPIHALRYE